MGWGGVGLNLGGWGGVGWGGVGWGGIGWCGIGLGLGLGGMGLGSVVWLGGGQRAAGASGVGWVMSGGLAAGGVRLRGAARARGRRRALRLKFGSLAGGGWVGVRGGSCEPQGRRKGFGSDLACVVCDDARPAARRCGGWGAVVEPPAGSRH